jgi:hypothetical protein
VAWLGLMICYGVLQQFPGKVIPNSVRVCAKDEKISGSSSGRAPLLFTATQSMAST